MRRTRSSSSASPAREARERAEPERGVGHGEEPEPARMAEGGGIGLSPRADRLARVVFRQRLVHRLDVRGPRTERFDLAEQGTRHPHRTSALSSAELSRAALAGWSSLMRWPWSLSTSFS